MTAVLVDDSPIELAIVNGILTRCGVQILAECRNGLDGMEAIRKLKPTFAILDIILPEMQGSTILANVLAEKLPTLCIMATSMQQMKEAVKAIGAELFLTKPYDPVTGEREVREIVERVANGGVS